MKANWSQVIGNWGLINGISSQEIKLNQVIGLNQPIELNQMLDQTNKMLKN